MQRITLIFKSKANKALDKHEDPRETLDYCYEKQLELLQKVRRGVADVATSRKRLELQINQLQQQSDKLQGQAQQALAGGPRGPRPRGAHPQVRRSQQQIADLQTQHAAAAGRGGEAHDRLPAAAGQGRVLPHQEGDDQGHVHRGRGADQDQRGVLRHLRGDGRRRHGDRSAPRTRPRRCRPAPAPSTSCIAVRRARRPHAARPRTTSRSSSTKMAAQSESSRARRAEGASSAAPRPAAAIEAPAVRTDGRAEQQSRRRGRR